MKMSTKGTLNVDIDTGSDAAECPEEQKLNQSGKSKNYTLTIIRIIQHQLFNI